MATIPETARVNGEARTPSPPDSSRFLWTFSSTPRHSYRESFFRHRGAEGHSAFEASHFGLLAHAERKRQKSLWLPCSITGHGVRPPLTRTRRDRASKRIPHHRLANRPPLALGYVDRRSFGNGLYGRTMGSLQAYGRPGAVDRLPPS
jgi:hypothetical protein